MKKLTNNLNRRWVLAGGAASGVLGVTGLSAQISPSPAPSNLKVTVTLNGATYTYPNGPKIPSYYVGFRQDGRVVFHLGALGILTKSADTPKPYHLGPHRVRVEDGEKILIDLEIPAHWWNAEWTYRPVTIAAKRTPAQVVAANRMFPYGDTGAKVIAPSARFPFVKPGDTSNITKYMPTTGERADIGLITDNSANYMLGKDPAPMIDWAQANGSCPVFFRDETTGKPVNLLTYPKANSYFPGGPYPFMPAGPVVNGYPTPGGDWRPQQAHYPELSYVAYMATLDLGFLENVQYNANWTVFCDPYDSNRRNIATVRGEYRGIAWAFRNLFMARVATADAEARGELPDSCHPSSYWKTLLDNQLAYYSAALSNPNAQTFRLLGGDGRFSPWMADYMSSALAFGVLTGHSDWEKLYLWTLGNVIRRTNGTSGYPPGLGTSYRFPAAVGLTWGQAFDAMVGDPEGGISQAQHDALVANPLNGGVAMIGKQSMMATRAVLVMAQYLHKKGIVDVKSVYPELDLCASNADRMARNYGTVNPRASVIL